MRIPRRVLAYILAPYSAVALAGCAGNHGEVEKNSPTTAVEVPQVNTTFQWIDSPDRLRNSDATFVRAYAESYLAFAYTGKAGAVYPGFTRANRGLIDLQEDKFPPSKNEVQTIRLKILRVSTLNDGSVSAILCDGVVPRELNYVRGGSPPPDNQSGPARRPTKDVFGDWHVTWWGRYSDQPSPEFTACEGLDRIQGSAARQDQPIPGWPGAA